MWIPLISVSELVLATISFILTKYQCILPHMTQFLFFKKAQQFLLYPIYKNHSCTKARKTFKVNIVRHLLSDGFTGLLAVLDVAAGHISSPWSSLCCMADTTDCQLCTCMKYINFGFGMKCTKNLMQCCFDFLTQDTWIHLHKTAEIC